MNVRQSKVVTNGERTSCSASPEDLPGPQNLARPLSQGRGYCLPWKAGRNQAGAGIRAGGGIGTREEREAGGTTVRARDPGSRLRAALVAAAGRQGTGDLGPARAFRHPLLPDAQRADRPLGSDGRGPRSGQAASPAARTPRADPLGAGREGANPEGANPQGAGPEGANPEGANPQGAGPEGANPEGANPEGAGSE